MAELWQLASVLFGFAIFLGIMWWAANAHSRIWRLVSASHPNAEIGPVTARRLDTIVIARRGLLGPMLNGSAKYRQYAGTIISVTSTGLTFSVVAPLNIVCPSFSVPFEQLKLERTSWALWPEPFALRIKRRPDYDIILGQDTVQWIRAHTDRPPFGMG